MVNGDDAGNARIPIGGIGDNGMAQDGQSVFRVFVSIVF